MKEKQKPNTALRLHPGVKEASQKYASENGLTLTGLISQLLRDHLTKNKITWVK